jgi:hypothetical protein
MTLYTQSRARGPAWTACKICHKGLQALNLLSRGSSSNSTRWPLGPPGRMSPLLSASSIMFLPMRSLTLLHGSFVSSLAATRAPAPCVTFLRYTMGVLPAAHRLQLPQARRRAAPCCARIQQHGTGWRRGSLQHVRMSSLVHGKVLSCADGTYELGHAVGQLGARLQRGLLARQRLLCGLRNRPGRCSGLALRCCEGAQGAGMLPVRVCRRVLQARRNTSVTQCGPMHPVTNMWHQCSGAHTGTAFALREGRHHPVHAATRCITCNKPAKRILPHSAGLWCSCMAPSLRCTLQLSAAERAAAEAVSGWCVLS